MPKETFFNLKEEKQEKVMRTAINEFLSCGYEGANVGKIAKRASVAKGSMYQYFENKKELFLFSVQWATKYIITKYDSLLNIPESGINFFDYIYESSKELWSKITEERDLIIFIQDVFLGKYRSVTDESLDYMLKMSEGYTLEIIRQGKKLGHIRKDIDDNILAMFMTGTSMKIKEYMMNKARMEGTDIIDGDFGKVDKDIKAMLELMKNGAGSR